MGEGGVCPEMCVGTGLRAGDMQPYEACSPPPPRRRCCPCLLCDADPDPDLACAHPFSCARDSLLLLLLLLLFLRM